MIRIWLLLLLPATLLADDSSTRLHRFQPFCNYLCNNSSSDCPDPVQFEFVPCSQTHTAARGVFPQLLPIEDDDITNRLLNSGSIIWTSKATGKQYQVVNGGAPQYANLSLHLDTLVTTIDDWIPSIHYNGNMVLDFEPWTPVWEQNRVDIPGFHARIYQEYSRNKIAEEHLDWNETEIEREAARVFQMAGVEFFVATLQMLQKLRPQAKIGFYRFPENHDGGCTSTSADPTKMRCGYDNPITGPALRKQNDAVAPIFQASSALFPSVYLQPQHNETFDVWRTYNLKYVNDTTHEAKRMVQTYTPKSPIRPFHWAHYHNGSTMLLPADVGMVAQYTYLPPWSTAVVQWGWHDKLAHWQTTVGGPAMKRAVDLVDSCSQRRCNNHGWCTQSTVYEGNLLDPCICDQGYQGSDCGIAVA